MSRKRDTAESILGTKKWSGARSPAGPATTALKAQVYFSPENHVCCIFSNEFETTFIMEANTMNPDQTAP